MKFAILGYGKMGKMVEQLLKEDHEEIVAIIDNDQDWQQQWDRFQTADVAIDFSMPDVAVANMLKAFKAGVPVVVGTTGWQEQLGYVRDCCSQLNGSLVFGSNFSIGANLFMRINKMLAALMDRQPQYAPSLEEVHHIHKKDAPSGTAITLAKDLISEVDRIDHWELTDTPLDDKMALPVTARREGEVPGIHTITWHSDDDDIQITHNAHNRKGFARGAIRAARWLTTHPGIYDFPDIVLSL